MQTPKPTAIAKLKNSILNTALTTHYECWFNPPSAIGGGVEGPTGKPTDALIPNSRSDEDYMLSCVEASLPGTSLATAELTNDHTGITERHVHRRQYDTTASFTFLVDRNYKQIQLFETWIGYIVNEQSIQNPNYFYRVNFPKQYQTKIVINKFERDYKAPGPLNYLFLNAYPISIDAMPVTYEAAQVLRCTVNFNFSRYITGASVVKKASYPVLGESDSRLWRASTDELVKRDNENYGNTVPVGSFGISNSATSAKREVEAQIHKDNAMYGTTWPAYNNAVGNNR
tara:strand:- start:35 stop:892 length:858 start_codon:yes stop_codon:yes gene_type:complete